MLRFAPFLLVLAAPAMAEVPRVAVDIPPIHSLVAQVMEGVAVPDLVLPPGLSPHDVALRPSDAAALAGADLLVWIGPELSPAITRSVEALVEGQILTLLDVPETTILEFREGAVFVEIGGEHDEHDEHEAHGEHEEHEEHGEHEEHAEHEEHSHDHDHDHDHGPRDPHAWLDPVNAMLWVAAIEQTLAEMDPENAGTYAQNARAAEARLAALQNTVEARVAPLRGRRFVVFHDAYHYFEARFEIEASGAITIGDGAVPGPRRLEEIGHTVEDLQITCVFAEPQFNPGLVEATLSEAGAQVGVIDPLGFALEPGPDLYEGLLNGMAASFEGCLTPQ